MPPMPQEYIPPAVVGFDWPAASPTVTMFLVTNSLIGPFTHMGANIFLIAEYLPFPLRLRKSSKTAAALIPLPATPTLASSLLVGMTHAKNPGYFSWSR